MPAKMTRPSYDPLLAERIWPAIGTPVKVLPACQSLDSLGYCHNGEEVHLPKADNSQASSIISSIVLCVTELPHADR